MSRREKVLTALAVLFAATTTWLALQLKAERNHSAVARSDVAPRQVPVTRPPPVPAARPTRSSGAAPALEPADSRDMPQGHMPTNSGEDLALAVAYLQQGKDPKERQSLLAQFKAGLRTELSRLNQKLQLSRGETEALLDFLAESCLEMSLSMAACRLDKRCDPMTTMKEIATQQGQAQLAYLGADRYRQLDQYRQSMLDRRDVESLQGRMSPGHALSDATAERLIVDLAEERIAALAAAEARGEPLQGLMNSSGSIYSRAAQEGVTMDARIESGAQYSIRLRERAARLLTPSQMEVFNQMQDETLEALRQQLRDEATLNSIRKAATATQ